MASDQTPAPYTRGWRAPWRRQWGTLSDGHSKLSILAKRIEAELLQEYRADTPHQRRELRQAARCKAQAERILATIGADPASTRRALTAYQAAAERVLAGLPRTTGPAPDVAQQLAGARR